MEVTRNKETMWDKINGEGIISDWKNETLGEDNDFGEDSDV